MKRLRIFLFLFVVLTANSGAGEEYRNWKGYPPVYDINDLIEFKGQVYGITKGGLFVYNPATQKYKLFYKNNGLVSNNVLCIGATSKEIFIGFQEEGLWRFDPETETFQQILFPEYHTKTSMHENGIPIYDIFAKNDSILYIGHEDGLDMLNLNSEELRSYTNLGVEFSENTAVNQVKIFDGRIWVCTPLGLAVADENNPNLEFGENWKNYTYLSTAINCIIRTKDTEDEVYLGTNRAGIARLDEKNDRVVPTNITGGNVSDFYEFKWKYWAATDNGLFLKQASVWSLEDNEFLYLSVLAAEGYERLWVGTMQNGLQCYSSWDYFTTPPHSEMRSETFYDLDTGESDVLWAATAYRDLNPGSVFQVLYGDTWTKYTKRDHTWSSRVVTTLVDNRGLIWAGTWGMGLFVLEDDGLPDKVEDNVWMVDIEKEYIRPTQADYYIVCCDLAKDRHGNIWVANFQSDDHRIEAIPTSGAVVLDGFPFNQAQNYSPAYDDLPTAMIFTICPDEDGWVWLGTADKGVIGLYVGDDPFDKEDTEIHVLNLEDGIHSTRIYALAYDQEGAIWVGTEAGLNRITKGSGHSLHVDDMNEILENTDRDIKVIEMDRLKNKWIGTSGGLLKINAQNELEEIYTSKNSGLFSDVILSLKYDNESDILWVGTGSGLNRFDVYSREITGEYKDVHVYPNPLEIWGYDSSAVFTNLEAGSTVKIYTFTGVLVNELTAGSTTQGEISKVTWSGKNLKGTYVGSGIYIFTGVDLRGREFVDKLAVIRR